MMTHACPSCGYTMQTPEEQAGQPLTCPKCNAAIRVPAAAKSSNTCSAREE